MSQPQDFYVCLFVCTTLSTDRLEDIFRESILSFCQETPKDGTQVIRLGSNCLYQMRHLVVIMPPKWHNEVHSGAREMA